MDMILVYKYMAWYIWIKFWASKDTAWAYIWFWASKDKTWAYGYGFGF